MALVVKDKIQTNAIITKFVNDVKNIILSGVYHSGNIPYCNGYQCVPTELLGNIDALPNPDVGTDTNGVSAQNIYDALVQVTQILTCVGTFSYVRRQQGDNNTYTVTGQMDGTVLFKPEKAVALGTVQNTEVIKGKPITVSSISNLIQNCLTAWRNTSKYHYVKTDDYCHSSCHSNCYYDCHDNCNVHICYSNGSCYRRPGCWDGYCYN